jgi:tetratricopeptide (TPR) repeat protein
MLGVVGCSESIEQLVIEAAAIRKAGNLRAAAIKLDASLGQQPKNVSGRMCAAQVYIERGDAALGLSTRAREDGIDQQQSVKLWAQAEFVAQRCQEILDDTSDLSEELSGSVRAGLLACRGGAPETLSQAAAQRVFKDGLAVDPHSVDVRVISGRVAIDRGDIEGARRLLAAVMREAPNDPRVRQIEGDIAHAAQDHLAAEQIYRMIPEAKPWTKLIRGHLAAIQVEDKLSEAISTVDTVLLNPKPRDIPKHPLLNYVRALATFRQNDYAAAQSNAAAVAIRVPGFERACLMAGAESHALKTCAQACYYPSSDVSANPGDIATHKLLATSQLQFEHVAAAADSARAETVRENDAARRRLAELQLRRRDTEQGANSLTDWLEACSTDNETLKGLTEIYASIGRLFEARAQYVQLAEQESKYLIFQNDLAWLLARTGHWQEALLHARMATASQPEAVRFVDMFGAILLQTGKSGGAGYVKISLEHGCRSA